MPLTYLSSEVNIKVTELPDDSISMFVIIPS